MSRDDYDDRDRDDRPRRRDDRDDRGGDDIADAKRKVKPPAIALLVVGILSLLFIGWGTYQYIFTFDKDFDAEVAKAEAQQSGNEQQKQAVREMMGTMKQVTKVGLPIAWVVQGVIALVMIFGSTRMMSMSSRGWARAAAVTALIPHLSCLVYLFSLAFGIWALVALANPVVKKAFAAKSGKPTRRDDDDFDRR